MKFSYIKDPIQPSPVFPRSSVLRPKIHIALKSGNSTPIDTLALIDSGSDYCLSCADFGEAIGLTIENEFDLSISGISLTPITFYFHDIKLIVGGWEKDCKMGFSRGFNFNFVVLGQSGFFDLYKVTFDYKKEVIELREY